MNEHQSKLERKATSRMRWPNASIFVLVVIATVFFALRIARPLNTAPPKADLASVPVEPQSSGTATGAEQTEPADPSEMVRRDLFQRRAAEQVRQKMIKGKNSTVNSYTLGLKLCGTMVGSDQEPMAVIQELGGAQRMYRQGEPVGKMMVRKIFRTKVELDVDGQVGWLEMEDAGAEPGRGKSSEATASFDDSAANPFRLTERAVVRLDRVSAFQVVRNLRSSLQNLRVRPLGGRGKNGGLHIGGMVKTHSFSQLGIRNGDIVTHVNGDPVGAIKDVVVGVNNAASDGRIELWIERQGQKRIIDISYNDG